MTIIQTFLFYLFDPAVPAEDKLLFAHAAVPGHVEDHEEVVDQGGVHPDTSITQHTQYPDITEHMQQVVWLHYLYGFPFSFLNSALQMDVNSLMLMALSLCSNIFRYMQ